MSKAIVTTEGAENAMMEDWAMNVARASMNMGEEADPFEIGDYMPDTELIPVNTLAQVVTGMIAPVFEQFGQILERTNQAIERIAASNQMMNARITELEKQIRLKTPVSRSQEKCINDAIRARSLELLEAKGFADDRKAVTKMGTAIRKEVLARYGCGALREYPAYDYETALEQVRRWNDLLTVREIVKEAKGRASETGAGSRAERRAGDAP